MAHFAIKLPDVGEGVAEAELVEWHVKVGDIVREDDLLAAVMTDKATVEIPPHAQARWSPSTAKWARRSLLAPNSCALRLKAVRRKNRRAATAGG